MFVLSQVVQIVLWYLDSGCSRHMTGDRARLINFVEKFIGTVRFGNDEYAAIVGYGDYNPVFSLEIMSITKEQQQALDNALVPREQRLTIGSCNYRLSTTFKPKEPTFQVALDVLSLTPFYPAFLITASVPAVYMHEFWATASYHKHSIRFKLNTKSYSFDLDTFRNMLQMCPKLPGQKFVDPPFEEEILTFMRELGYSGNIKLLSDVKVEILPQPWRTFGTIINKCLSGKVTGLDTLRLSRAQILWGLYHQQKVDYVYLLWEDLVFQIENKESRKTKYIFIPQHEVVQKYGAILPDNLTTQAMKESEAYKTYYAFATGKAIPKPKYVRRSTKEKPEQAPEASSGTGVTPGVPDVPIYGSDEEQISWKSSNEEDDDDEANIGKDEDDNDQYDDERTEFDNDGDDFVHPKLSTHDDEARNDDEVNEEESNEESNDESNEESDEEVQGANIEEEEMDEEATHEEDEANELYRDVNVNLEGRDIVMTGAPLPNVQATYETEDTHVILTASINPEGQQQSSSVSSGFVSNMLNPIPDTGVDSIFILNTEATSLVDVPVTTIAEPPLVSATTLPPPPTPLTTHMQQTPVPTLTTIPTVSSIPDIVNAYFANKMHEAVKTVKIIKDQVKAQVKAQVSMILPKIEKTVNEQLKAEVMTSSSTESKTSLAIAANLSKLELKKILIDKMESNKSIHISDEQKNLYKALVEAYESDKLILNTYGDTVFTPKEKTAKSTGKSTEGSKSLHKSTHAEEPMHTAKDLEELAHQEFETRATEDQPFQPWLSNLAWEEVDTLTPELLIGQTFELMKGTCKSLVKLEYFFEEVYKATTDQLDWNNPEGQQYPHDLRKPLPLIPNSHSRQVIPFDHFVNNHLAYLSGGVSSRTYATSVMKTKAATYGHIKWIEDLVPNIMWSEVSVNYDKHALWGISHWGCKRQQFYGFATNKESARDVYYKHDDKLYTFKEGDFKRLCLQDIKDMLIFLAQGKLTNLNVEDRLAFGVSLSMFTRSIVIQRRVEDL
ncbi:hypothetical protein Tco_0997650 [Tanacetum coccineum]